MAEVARQLDPPTDAVGRVIQFIALRSGDGVSTLARAFAQAVSIKAGRGVWLVELDVLSGVQAHAIAAQPDLFGKLGPAVSASPDGTCFFRITSPNPDSGVTDASCLVAHAVGPHRMWVTRFRNAALGPGQAVEMRDTGEYWEALRGHADWVVVDAPPLERSGAGLVTAGHVDGNILVLDASRGDLAADAVLRDRVLNAGGRVAGAVLNRAPGDIAYSRGVDPERRRR